MPSISEIPKLLDLDSQEILKLVKNNNDLYQVIWRLYLECYRRSLEELEEEDFMKEFMYFPNNNNHLLPLNCLTLWNGQYMTETVTDYTKKNRVQVFIHNIRRLLNDLQVREKGLMPNIITIPKSNDYNQILFTNVSQMEEFVGVAGVFMEEIRKNYTHQRLSWK